MNLNPQLVILVTFLIFVVFVVTGKLKIHVAAMMIPISLEVTGVLNFKEAWGGMLNSSIIMMAAMFIVGAALTKTDLISRVSKAFIKPGATDLQIVLGLTVPYFLLGCVVNGTATATIMIPMVTAVCAEHKRPMSKIIYPLMIMSGCFTGLLPIGGNAAGYLTNNRIVEELGGVGGFTYWTNTLLKIPMTIIMFVVAITIIMKMVPDNGNIPGAEMGAEAAAQASAAVAKRKSTLTPFQDKAVKIIFICTVAGIVYCAATGHDTWWPACIGAFLMILSGALSDREAMIALNNPVIFITIGTLPLATALSKTGTDQMIADWFRGFTSSMPPVGIAFSMYFICFVLTQFLTNSAVNNIFKMLAALIAIQNGFSPTALMIAAQQGTANSHLLPTASPVATLMYEAGGYTTKQWFKLGIAQTIAGFVVFLTYIQIFWPLA